MHWINETILSMGGMQACGLTLEKTPTAGTFTANIWTWNVIEYWFWWSNHSHWHDELLMMLSLSMWRCVLFNNTTTATSDSSFIYQVNADVVKEKGWSECSCLMKDFRKTTNPHCTRRSLQEREKTDRISCWRSSWQSLFSFPPKQKDIGDRQREIQFCLLDSVRALQIQVHYTTTATTFNWI